jgi:hypothetical protein
MRDFCLPCFCNSSEEKLPDFGRRVLRFLPQVRLAAIDRYDLPSLVPQLSADGEACLSIQRPLLGAQRSYRRTTLIDSSRRRPKAACSSRLMRTWGSRTFSRSVTPIVLAFEPSLTKRRSGMP